MVVKNNQVLKVFFFYMYPTLALWTLNDELTNFTGVGRHMSTNTMPRGRENNLGLNSLWIA